LIFLAGLVCAAAAFAQAPAPVPAAPAADPAELFGIREGVEQIDISPDGQHVVYLQPGPGRTTLIVISDLGANAAPRAIFRADGNPERIRWCRFVSNDRLICRIRVISGSRSLLSSFNRLISIDTNGQNLKSLGQHESLDDARVRYFDAAVIDWLPGQNGEVLMARDYVPEAGRTGSLISRAGDGLGVDRIDPATLHSSRVEPPNRNAAGYMSDGRGNVRMMIVQSVRGGATGQLGTRIDYFYRPTGSHDWRPFGSYDFSTREGMAPIAVDATLDAAYVLQKLNGRLALYRVKLDGSMTSELVYANDHVDVDDVVRASDGARVIGVTFAEERQRVVYFDPEYQAIARTIGHALPNLPLVDFGDASADGNQILVHAGADNDAGRYYVFDRQHHSLNEILMVRPPLEHVALANVRAVTYPAADGVQVPAYLTLPPGSTGRNLPTVILPHGGPEARDVWGFDWLAQYFAHLGYAVLQPNFRGSGGFGDAWLRQNGFRGWRTSVGDITAGARWLAAQGIADPNRMAIVGWSYGGYAALQAGVTEPGLFKAIVAIAPVTDLQQLKLDAAAYNDASNIQEEIGSGPHITEGSPLQNVASITAPVLLFHGDRDLNVNVIHSRRMDEALRGAGKSSELTLFPGLEHDLADSEARSRMLRRIGAFLGEKLGRP
jgi:dipeptidyl aminopeptidase/acylaminoacyl peptidase